jgi:hypothetical protein
MKFLIILSLTLLFASCSSDSMSKGNAEILGMFGPFEFEITNSPEKGEVQSLTFSNPIYLSDSTNRPGIAGASVLALYRNFNEEEKKAIDSYDIRFGTGDKSFRYELPKSAAEELYGISERNLEYANLLFTRQYSDFLTNADTLGFHSTLDSIRNTFANLIPDSVAIDSMRIYSAYPTSVKPIQDSVLKVYRYSTLVYQKKKTFYFYCTINRSNQRILGVKVVPKNDQREFSLPL